MGKRLDHVREKELTPKRFDFAVSEIEKLGFDVKVSSNEISFIFKGSKVVLFPYSGWHSGKTIKDGRGVKKLLNQLRK